MNSAKNRFPIIFPVSFRSQIFNGVIDFTPGNQLLQFIKLIHCQADAFLAGLVVVIAVELETKIVGEK